MLFHFSFANYFYLSLRAAETPTMFKTAINEELPPMVIIFLALNSADFSMVMGHYIPPSWLSMAPCAALHPV